MARVEILPKPKYKPPVLPVVLTDRDTALPPAAKQRRVDVVSMATWNPTPEPKIFAINRICGLYNAGPILHAVSENAFHKELPLPKTLPKGITHNYIKLYKRIAIAFAMSLLIMEISNDVWSLACYYTQLATGVSMRTVKLSLVDSTAPAILKKMIDNTFGKLHNKLIAKAVDADKLIRKMLMKCTSSLTMINKIIQQRAVVNIIKENNIHIATFYATVIKKVRDEAKDPTFMNTIHQYNRELFIAGCSNSFAMPISIYDSKKLIKFNALKIDRIVAFINKHNNLTMIEVTVANMLLNFINSRTQRLTDAEETPFIPEWTSATDDSEIDASLDKSKTDPEPVPEPPKPVRNWSLNTKTPDQVSVLYEVFGPDEHSDVEKCETPLAPPTEMTETEQNALVASFLADDVAT